MKASVHRQDIVEVLLVAIVLIAVNLVSAAFQKPVTYNDGKGWDGVEYYAVAAEFSQGHIPAAEAPFVYRIGTPFLASLLFKDDLLLSFKIVNLVANILAVFLLLFWLRLYLKNWIIRTLLIFLFIAQWHAPIRFNYFLPVSVDPWLFVFMLAGLIGIHYAVAKPTLPVIFLLSLGALLASAFKEVAIVLPISFLFSKNPIAFCEGSIVSTLKNVSKSLPVRFLAPLFSAVIGLASIHLLVSQTNEFSFPIVAVQWAYDKPLLNYVYAWFIAFGPILVFLLYDWRKAWAFLLDHQFQLVFLICVSLLGWIGGNDTERFLYWAMPVIFVLLGRAIENLSDLLLASPLLVAVLGLAQAISERLVWITPDYPSVSSHSLILFTPLGSNIDYLDLWSYAWLSVKATALFEYLVFAVLLLIWLNYRARKRLQSPSPAVSP